MAKTTIIVEESKRKGGCFSGCLKFVVLLFLLWALLTIISAVA